MLRVVKAFRRVVKRGSVDREQKDFKQLGLVQTLKAELQDQYRPYKGKKKSDNDTTQYTTSRRIQQRVLTRERLRSLFKSYAWWEDSGLDELYAKFTCVIATLITIEWIEWEDFGTLFLDHRDEKKRPLRCDDQLPFDEDALKFLRGDAFRRTFLLDQHIYNPVVLVEDEHQTFSLNQRLPFVEPSTFVNEGSYGRILATVVDDHQLKYTREFKATDGLIANVRTPLALKEIIKRESWERECFIQELLKQCSTRHRSLLLSFSSFERGQQLGIFYPLAELDLAKFLLGNYPDFPQRASLFKPHHVFQQMSLLAEAFHWMHEQLSLDGDKSKCYHHDFKASNVLVFWASKKDLAGEWKIIDFGLGHFSPHRARPASRYLGVLLELSDTSSNIDASRDPGPHSAPEMHIGGQVSGSADRYSYGTVYAEVLAFYIGGPNMVRELTLQRHKGSNGCFWVETSVGNAILKPSVDQWLENLTIMYGAHQPFVTNAVQYIRGLLMPNRDSRMRSLEMEQSAKTLEKSTRNLSFNWIVPVSEGNGLVSASTVLPRPSSVSTVASRVTYTDATPISAKQQFLDFLRSKRRTKQQQTLDKDRGAGRGMAQFMAISSTSFWPTPPKLTQYHRVCIPSDTLQTRIGANAQIASFCSPEIVYLYDIRTLSDDTAHWSASPEMLTQSSARSLLPVRHFDAPVGRLWKSVLMEGNFVAFWSCSHEFLGPDKVSVFEYAPSSREIVGQVRDLKYDITLGKNCLDVQLSSRGHLVLIYDDHIELQNRNGKLFPEGRASPSVKKAAFSNDGDTLCVWRHDADAHLEYWHFFTVSDDQLDVYKHWKYRTKPPRPQDAVALGVQELQDVILVAFQNETGFLACDETGQMIYLDTSGRESLKQSNDTCEGAYMALPCAEGSVALLRKCDEDPLSNVSIAISRSRAGHQHVELLTQWATIGRSKHGTDCGAVTFSEGSRIGLMASFPDGTIVRLGD